MVRSMGIVFFLAVAACNGNQGNEKTATTDTAVSTASHQLMDSASASSSAGTEHTDLPGYAIMQQQDCKTCHTPDKLSTGPSFMMIAARYDVNKPGTVEHLAKKVISGGKGSFGDAMMTPHASLSEKDAEELVRYVLSYKN